MPMLTVSLILALSSTPTPAPLAVHPSGALPMGSVAVPFTAPASLAAFWIQGTGSTGGGGGSTGGSLGGGGGSGGGGTGGGGGGTGGVGLGGGDSTRGGDNDGVGGRSPSLRNPPGIDPIKKGSDGINAEPLPDGGGSTPPPPPPPGPPPGGGSPPNPDSGGTPAPPIAGPGANPAGPQKGTTAPGPRTHSPFADLGYDPADWSLWWRYNKAPYLELRKHLFSGPTTTGSDEVYLGHGEMSTAGEGHRPRIGEIRDQVVPALLEALKINNVGVRGGALMALGRIGKRGSADGSTFVNYFRDSLRSGNQELEETATLALGILQDPAAIPILTELMLDSREGRKIVGGGEVPYRMRAFATYGLGLIASAVDQISDRQLVAESLIGILEGPKMSTQDLKVAAIAAFGLVRLPERPTVPRHATTDYTQHVLSRRAQIRYLTSWLETPRRHTGSRHWRIRSHAPTALARLCVGMPDTVVEPVIQAMLGLVRSNSKERDEVQQSCALALGDLIDCDAGGIDHSARQALLRLSNAKDRITRRFAMMSLGEVAGRPGNGDNPWMGQKSCRESLLLSLSKDKSGTGAWAGLALGLMGRGEAAAGGLPNADAVMALRTMARRCKKPGDIGAYALALGLLRDTDSDELLSRQLKLYSDDTARGHIAIALGLIEAKDAIQDVHEIAVKSRFKPGLMAEASMAAGLLGDKELVTDLLDMLRKAKAFSTQASVATSLGLVGDHRSVAPLVEMLNNDRITDSARAFAASSLGMVCDKELLPWNSKLSMDSNYLATTGSFAGTGRGVLDIL